MTTVQMPFVSLTSMGAEAKRAHQNIQDRYGVTLPRLDKIKVAIEKQGRFTIAAVKAGERMALGVAARNRTDAPNRMKGNMTALVRALKELGGVEE